MRVTKPQNGPSLGVAAPKNADNKPKLPNPKVAESLQGY